MRFFFGIFLWWIYMPLIRVLSWLLFFHPKLRDRYQFEKRNKFEYLAQSFKEWGETADLCFEFSSEGEFQQVAPLVHDALAEGKKVELVFFSPSVEKAIMNLAEQYPRQIRYLRFPILRILPFVYRRSFNHWVSAKTLILVRYDLLPEIYYWSLKNGNELRMIWVTFKKERSGKKEISPWKKSFLKRAKKIIYAGETDQKQGEVLGFKGHIYDFRIEQIRRRLVQKTEKFQTAFPAYPKLSEILQEKKTLIVGNAWPSDLFLLEKLPKDVFLMIVPHQLSLEIITAFEEGLRKLGRIPLVYTDGELSSTDTLILNKKGVLCELYADFQYAYVGGGFEGSIHSVLEPLISGSVSISCGPRHHRSTEFDLAHEMNRIVEVKTPDEFLDFINSQAEPAGHDKLEKLIGNYQSLREYVITC